MTKRNGVLAALTAVTLTVVGISTAGLWNGSGGFFDFMAGQFEPEPRQLSPLISQQGTPSTPYEVTVTVDSSRPIGEVTPQYISFAIDASQVTGGKWWNPAALQKEMGSGTLHAPKFNFNRPALDSLAKALSPAYLRIGGSEADKVFYDLSTGHSQALDDASTTPPPGYQSVLTRVQWDALNAFASRNHLDVFFTLNAGPGSRQRGPEWSGENARELIAYTAQKGYPVKVWELGNELNLFWFVHGLGQQVSTTQYAKDLQSARQVLQAYYPTVTLGGQGSAFWPILGEPLSIFYGYYPDYLQSAAGLTDQVTWHYYPQQSRRGPIASRRAFPSRMLNPRNLDEVGVWADRIRVWRDTFAPGKPIWLGETGNAQYGGEPGLSDVYLGGLWWLDQLGLLARKDTKVVVRQTLAGMNYGMIDDATLLPRPDYWNSWLWKQLMGSKVYQVSVAGNDASHLRAYAHSSITSKTRETTVLLINIDPEKTVSVNLKGLPDSGRRVFAVTTPDIFGQHLMVNGRELSLGASGEIPELGSFGSSESQGTKLFIHPLSYTFVQLIERQ